MTGIIGVFCLCKCLKESFLESFFMYIGDKTLYTLTYSYLSFKLVSYIMIYATQQPLDYLTQFPVIESPYIGMRMIYTIIGITVPLAI